MKLHFKMKNRIDIINFILYSFIFNVFFSYQNIYGEEFQYQYRSARYLGRGDTGVANTSGSDAMFYNPAGIIYGNNIIKDFVLLSPQVEGSQNVADAYDKRDANDKQMFDFLIANTNKPFYLGVQNLSALVFKKFALGAMQRGDAKALVYTDPATGMPYVNVKADILNGFYLGLAQDFYSEHLSIGMTAKVVQKREYNLTMSALEIDAQLQNSQLQSTLEATGRRGVSLGADFGGILVFDKETETQVGAVIKNLGMDYSWVIPSNGYAPAQDFQQVNVGVSSSFGTKRGRVKLLADYNDVFNIQNQYYFKHTHAGLEYNFENIFIAMVGMNQGYITYGLSLNAKIFRFEAGSYTEEMGFYPGQRPNKRYFGRISTGWIL